MWVGVSLYMCACVHACMPWHSRVHVVVCGFALPQAWLAAYAVKSCCVCVWYGQAPDQLVPRQRPFF